MTRDVELKKLLIEIIGANPNLPIKGTVKSVEGDSCTVELKSGLKLTDVKLKATITDTDNYFMLIPKVNSKVVLMSLTGELDNTSVIKVDEVEKIEYKQNGLEFLVDSTDKKVQIKNADTSLLDVFKDLTTLLKVLRVYTPSGVSGNPIPSSINRINQLEVTFNKILK